jgi:hypothetical protein
MRIRFLFAVFLLCCVSCTNNNKNGTENTVTQTKAEVKDSNDVSSKTAGNKTLLQPIKKDTAFDFSDPGHFFYSLAETVFTNSSFPLQIISFVMNFTDDSTAVWGNKKK